MEQEPERIALTEILGNIPSQNSPEKFSDKDEIEKQIKMVEFWKRSGVPNRHLKFKPEQSRSGIWVSSYEKAVAKIGTGSILAILGNRGTGKTQMSACLIREACKKLLQSRYTKALDFFLTIRSSDKGFGPYSEQQNLNSFISPELLVIDALEVRGETPFEDRLLSHIIDRRYDEMKDTILISNQTPDAFDSAVGASIVSRINETGGKIICDWDGFRG